MRSFNRPPGLWFVLGLLAVAGAWLFYLALRPVPAPRPVPPSPEAAIASTPSPTPGTAATPTPRPSATSAPAPATSAENDQPEADVETSEDGSQATSTDCLDGICEITEELPGPSQIRMKFVDSSSTHDWTSPDSRCLAAIGGFLEAQEMAWSDIAVELSEELTGASTRLEFQFPPPEDPLQDPADYSAGSQCEIDEGRPAEVACRVVVIAAPELPHPHMDVALAAALLDALRRAHYEELFRQRQSEDSLEPFYHASQMEMFEPVLESVAGEWQSRCQRLLGPPVERQPADT